MKPNYDQYLQSAQRGATWLLGQQSPDGSFLRSDLQADVYHKAPLALAISGHPIEANRVLEWIKHNDLRENGDLHHFHDGLGLYKTCWVVQGAHRLARFDISFPVMRHVVRCQAPCGGFFQVASGNDTVEPVCTAAAGMAALYTGYTETAQQVAACLLSMLHQQPDRKKFYYHMTPDGRLVTDTLPSGEPAPFVDATRAQQAYYCPGLAFLFLTRLYLATGDDEYLDGARRFFENSLEYASDRYSYPTAGKSAVGAAIYYTITRDPRAKAAAQEFAEYLLQMQRPDGSWCNPHDDGIITLLDHTAEFVVWMSEIALNLGS